MHAKVLALVALVRQGFAVERVQDARHGGVRISLLRGTERRHLAFAPYEVPAIVQECTSLGLAK